MRRVIEFPDGSSVRPDPLTPWWTAHPRPGWVLRGEDGLARQYRTADAAALALRALGYAAGDPLPSPQDYSPGEPVVWANNATTRVRGTVVGATTRRVAVELVTGRLVYVWPGNLTREATHAG
jgi:hypothetical protein